MPKDDRNLLEVLKFELEFLEQGGYGRLPRESWKPRFIFEDSPTCMNFNSKDHEPCEECLLMQFVPEKARTEQVPCTHIPLSPSGETLESLYRTGTLAAGNNPPTGSRKSETGVSQSAAVAGLPMLSFQTSLFAFLATVRLPSRGCHDRNH
jgi:hypothetical protein